MKAREIMTPTPAVCTPEDTIRDAARLMRDYDVGSLPVVENTGQNRLVGIVTDRDLAVGPLADGRFDARVSDVMTPNPSTVRDSDDVEAISRLMASEQVRRIPVVDELGSVIGMVAQADLALADRAVSATRVEQVVESISRPSEGRRTDAPGGR